MLLLSIENETGDQITPECEDAVRNAASIALCLEREGQSAEANLLLTTSRRIRQLNKRFRRIDAETDVLSFPQRDSFDFWPDGVLLGDIAISLEKAKAQAEEYGHSLARELAFLTVHSCLHLFGYDHGTPEEESQMEKLQEAALEKAGIRR
jgi:probable rRNA maturation factor